MYLCSILSKFKAIKVGTLKKHSSYLSASKLFFMVYFFTVPNNNYKALPWFNRQPGRLCPPLLCKKQKGRLLRVRADRRWLTAERELLRLMCSIESSKGSVMQPNVRTYVYSYMWMKLEPSPLLSFSQPSLARTTHIASLLGTNVRGKSREPNPSYVF